MIARLVVFIAALAVLAYAAGLVLAGDFFPEAGAEGVGKREVVLLVVATLAASLLHVGACVMTHRNPPKLIWVLLVAVGARVLLLFGSPQPLLEGDHDRLRFDARMVNQRVHPYEFKPSHLSDARAEDPDLTGADLIRLGRARASMSASADAPRPEDLQRPDLRTASTPLALWIGALGDRFKPQSTRGFAFLVLVADAFALFFLLMALRAMKLPLSWIMVYAWCPVLLKEFYATLSIDAFVVMGVALLTWCIAAGRRLLAAIPVAIAASIRFPLLLLAPLVARRMGLVGLLLVAILVVLPFLPFHNPQVAPHSYFEGQVHVWRHYEYNSVLENPLRGTLRFMPQRAENSLTVAGVGILEPGDRLHELLAKVICIVVLLGVVVYLSIRVGPSLDLGNGGETRAGLNDLFCLLVTFLIVSPVLQPAHALWLLPLLVLRPRGLSWLLLPGLLCLSHLTHLVGPQAADLPLGSGKVSFRVFEYGLFLALLALDFLWARSIFPEPEREEEESEGDEEEYDFDEDDYADLDEADFEEPIPAGADF